MAAGRPAVTLREKSAGKRSTSRASCSSMTRRSSAWLRSVSRRVKARACDRRWISSKDSAPASSFNTARVLFFTSRVAANGKIGQLQEHRHDQQHPPLPVPQQGLQFLDDECGDAMGMNRLRFIRVVSWF